MVFPCGGPNWRNDVGTNWCTTKVSIRMVISNLLCDAIYSITATLIFMIYDYSLFQNFFLMEAGDTMFVFYTEIFDKVCMLQDFVLSLCMGKPTICIGENKDADQLRGNREADQRLCFRYSDSTISLLLKSEISSF